MIYHQLALNVPLDTLFTYAHPHRLPEGTRVAVPFRGKTVAALVWAADVAAEIDSAKIRPIAQVFDHEPPLDADWRALLQFAARYYHYPLGQAVFAALPQGLREARPVAPPPVAQSFVLSATGLTQAAPKAHHRKQLALWQALQQGALSLPAAKAIHTQAPSLLKQWQQQGWLDAIASPAHGAMPPSPHVLNEEQQAASQAVQAACGGFAPFLLHGITGSGKTEVYFDIMAKVLAAGRQVLFLLPEINLTPQLLARVQQRFPHTRTAVLHSQAAAGARTQDYLRAQSGQAALVVGTRLAVFTPLRQLGLVVVDEEHDSSFKQDSDLRYQARDLAVWRAQQAACPIVLGSATPSLESWHKARHGDYRLLSLGRRAHHAAALPQIVLADVRRQKLDNGFSAQALALLQQNHAQGGMSMVYLNRRGFAPALFCGDCGHTFGCPHCSAKMVLHQQARQLRCHHCDFRQPIPRICPDCGNQDLTAVGHGTQRVEETLRQALPGAAVVRVDRDSTARKQDWAQLYERIDAGAVDVLVGTQMLAKGHDFARLNLVLVLNADGSLYSADFRAPERLFAELMQVAGRAGRADAPGRVLVQTQLPDHAVFQALKAQDYPRFADAELAARQSLGLPPFAFVAAIRADAPSMSEAVAFLRLIIDEQANGFRLPETISQFGPVPMLMARLAGRERAQVFLEGTQRRDLHHSIGLWRQLLRHFETTHRAIRWSIDVDPTDI
ncbi:primosomal protein N' [Paralysiella testudinis]|uniref:Replication restart protein PriA n=1 Tax=Paralysiella testudinis TaxID=2809020 RepID=A0A892ZKX0_9NEIS|nr:primosomal protein N' [Paralysiella testudinis]QRQ83263.1 primosomal protein N' [Paralysiella testudinis]